ncbi:DUF5462 family protein [Salmonella enterica]|nr:hypothetical protein [Salmonella enterica]EHG7742692.1 hypothetical protein [Salmonella enterica]EIO1938471.1 DUF5462 family protein [Salmonella enterica]EJM4384190.1 DUF5462 family protein [Salmonella enterica]
MTASCRPGPSTRKKWRHRRQRRSRRRKQRPGQVKNNPFRSCGVRRNHDEKSTDGGSPLQRPAGPGGGLQREDAVPAATRQVELRSDAPAELEVPANYRGNVQVPVEVEGVSVS